MFYLNKIEDGVKKEVKDKERKKELKNLLSTYSQINKSHNKNSKKALDSLKDANLQYETSVDWYKSFFQRRMDERKEIQAIYIDLRLQLTQKITDEEWQEIIKYDDDSDPKEKEKLDQRITKSIESFNKHLEKVVDDPGNVEQLSKYYRDFLDEQRKFTNAFDEVGEYSNSITILSNKNASREDLYTIRNELNQKRLELYDSYVNFISKTKAISKKKDWQSIAKQVNKIY